MATRVLTVDCHFFAELSQAGCRTRGVDGRLVHPALGRIQRGQLLLTGLGSPRSAREFGPAGDQISHCCAL